MNIFEFGKATAYMNLDTVRVIQFAEDGKSAVVYYSVGDGSKYTRIEDEADVRALRHRLERLAQKAANI